MTHTIDDLIRMMGLVSAVATGSDTATVRTSLRDKCALLANRSVRILNAHGGTGYATGTVKRADGGDFAIEEVRYWPPEGGNLDLDVTVDRISVDNLRSDTLCSWWVYKEGPRGDEQQLVGQKSRARVSRKGNEVTLVLTVNGSCWTFLASD